MFKLNFSQNILIRKQYWKLLFIYIFEAYMILLIVYYIDILYFLYFYYNFIFKEILCK